MSIKPWKYTEESCIHITKYTAKLLQSCLTLCDPIDGSPPGSPVPGILQARTLEWVAISFSKFPSPNFILAKYSAAASAAKSLQSCPTLCNPRDSSPPGSPIPGILQARTLEWVAIAFSRLSTLSQYERQNYEEIKKIINVY